MTLDFFFLVSSLYLGPSKASGPKNRGCKKLFNQPSGEVLPGPRPGPHPGTPTPQPAPALPHSSHHPPFLPLAQLLCSPSSSLSPDFCTLGSLFLINIPQDRQHILMCLTSTPIPPSHPFPKLVIYYSPLLGLDSPARGRQEEQEGGQEAPN